MSRNINVQNSVNIVGISGKILDITVAEGVTREEKKPYARATVTVRETQTYGGKTETSEIPISFFANQYTKENKINPAFDQIQQLKNLKTAQMHGIEDADVLTIRRGQLQENNFISRTTGSLINGWQIRSTFYSVGGKEDTAFFDIEIFIMDMHDEMDKDGDPTGRLIIKGGVVQWGGRLDVLEFVVENPDSVDYISRNWSINDTVRAQGRVRITSIEVARPASSWGETIPETSTRAVRELVITDGSDQGLDEDFAFDATDIKKAFQVRKANIEQMMQDAKKPAPQTTVKASSMDWE